MGRCAMVSPTLRRIGISGIKEVERDALKHALTVSPALELVVISRFVGSVIKLTHLTKDSSITI
jgi:hypothetical protein